MRRFTRAEVALVFGLIVVTIAGFTAGYGTYATMSDTETADVSVAADTWATPEPTTTETEPSSDATTAEAETTSEADDTTTTTEASPATESVTTDSTATNTTTEQS